MSFIKLLATLGLLLSPPIAPAAAGQAKASGPEVQVPFGCGLSFQISQAHNTGSHLENDVWAWDFRMPVGVPIVAARAGVVRLARGDSKKGGCGPAFARDANYVVIDHGDQTEAQYLHFSSVVVQAGEKVNAGQLIGYSGETGWACGSHLHFKIARHVHNGWNNPSIPARIEGYGDPQTAALIQSPACPAKPSDVLQADARDVDTAPRVEQASGKALRATTTTTAVVASPVKAAGGAAERAGGVAGKALPDYTVAGSVAH